MAINAEATSNGSPLANGHAHDADLEAKQPLLLPTAVKRRVEQPRFAKLTLPPKYDNLSLVTRLWLQSRLVEPSEDKKDKKKEKEKEKGSGDDEKDKEKEGGEKSVAIATPDEPVFRTGGRKRPITPAALWVWLDLARVLAPYLRVALQHARPLRLAIYILKMVLDTLQPTFKCVSFFRCVGMDFTDPQDLCAVAAVRPRRGGVGRQAGTVADGPAHRIRWTHDPSR